MASNLHRIADAMTRAPETDAARVDAVRGALKHGTYRIDPGRIAARFIRLDDALNDGSTATRDHED